MAGLVVTQADQARLKLVLERNANRRVEILRGDIRDRQDSDQLVWQGKAHRVRPRSQSDGVQEGSLYDNAEYSYQYRLVGFVEVDTETHYLVDTTRDTSTYWELMDETHGAYDISTFLRVRDVT